MKKKLSALLLVIFLSLGATAAAPEVSPYHPWKGLKVAFLGDSITDANYMTSTKKYWQWLSEWLGITPYVYAKAGRQWNDLERQDGLLSAEHGTDFDAMMIFMGTNDFMNDVPMGEWYVETAEKMDFAMGSPKVPVILKKREMSFDDRTYRGRINKALKMFKEKYPEKQIVLLTPIHRAWFNTSEKNSQPGENYANRLGLYLEDYVRSVKEASEIWSVPVIDIYSLSGLYPLSDAYSNLFTNAVKDRLHPNSNGHFRMALTLLYQLSAIPGNISLPK